MQNTMLTSTIGGMEKFLDANPDDWGARLIYADMLLDAGMEKEAEFQRVLVKEKKCPSYDESYDKRWDWWANNMGGPFSDVGIMVLKKLPLASDTNIIANYPSRKEAEAALFILWFRGEWPLPTSPAVG